MVDLLWIFFKYRDHKNIRLITKLAVNNGRKLRRCFVVKFNDPSHSFPPFIPSECDSRLTTESVEGNRVEEIPIEAELQILCKRLPLPFVTIAGKDIPRMIR